MTFLNNLRPSYLVDKLLTLFLKIVLKILLKILYIIKGEDFIVTKVEVTIKKANEEKQYTHIIDDDAPKERAINQKDLISEPNLVTGTPSDINEQQIVGETKTDPNLVTGTLSELKAEEIIRDKIIDNKNEKSEESGIESTPEIQIPHLETGCPFEMKTPFNNNNGSDILPIKFCWKIDGQEVIITGDFDNWQATHKMDFNPVTKEFSAVIDINRNKQHEFKFIVDGDWRPNWDLPTRIDEHGNVNNIIYAFPSDPLSPEYKEYAAQSFQLTAAY
uniref:5'-AMP-activated protein kinase subunit beta-1 n=1 Tax=Anthurium amnicola TaxID=1678845 RepID=A0A1D1XRA8_9ARAE